MTKRSRWARSHAPSLVDRITVATRRGSGGLGPTLAPAVTVLGYAKGARTLTVGEDDEESAAEGTIRVAPILNPVDAAGDPLLADGKPVELDALALFALGSEVTTLGRTGRVTRVVGVTYRGRLERVDVTTS